VSVDADMTRSVEEEVPVCHCPPRVDLVSEDKSKTLPELSEGSTMGSLEPEGISATFHVAVSHRGCWVDKELLKTLSLTPGNHHYDPTYGLRKSLGPIRNLHYHFHSNNPRPYDTGVCNSQGTDYDFVGASRVLPALAAALPEHLGVETLAEMEVVIYELLTQLIVMAGRIGLGLGRNSFRESEDLGSSEEESSNGEARQEDADQLMEFENADNES
jgi:hypothetical protein